MMRKIREKEKNEVLNELSFYNFETFSLKKGDKVTIELNQELGNIRYCDVQYYNYDKRVLKEYLKKEKAAIQIFSLFIKCIDDEIIVFNYGDEWIKNKRLSPKLNREMVQCGISCDDAIFTISDIGETIPILKSIFRYNTFAAFLFQTKKIIIIPTDHLDFFVFGQFDLQKIITDVMENNTQIKQNFIIKKD